MSYISQESIILNLTAESATEAILALASLLEKKGLVNIHFGPSAIKREQAFPTGVPTQPYAIAFPHAEPSTVYQASLAIGTLTHPVSFGSMEEPNKELPVRAVFLLANRNPHDHVNVLKKLSRFFKKPDHLIRLLQMSVKSEVVNWLQEAVFPPSSSKNA